MLIKAENENTYREIARTEQTLQKKMMTAEDFGFNLTGEEVSVLGDAVDMYLRYFSDNPNNYGSKMYELENWQKLRQQGQEAKDTAKPVKRTVVIEKK